MAGKPPSWRSFNFDLVAPFYDLGIWLVMLFFGGERRLRERVVEACAPLDGARTLEIFAGTATLALLASERGSRATALDISAGMLRVAAEKAKGGERGGGLNLVRGDAVELPFSTGSFDRVIASMGLHEMTPGEARDIIAECLRVLKERGRLVIFDYHRAEGGVGFLQRLFFLFTEGAEAREWLGTDTQALLTRTGFSNFRRTFLLRGAMQLITAEKR